MSRTTSVRTIALALAAAAGSTARAGDTPPIRWAAPVSGGFYTGANWTGGVGPLSGAPAIIDAQGAAYTVGWGAALANFPRIRSILVDSPDATLLYLSLTSFSSDHVIGDIEIRRGALDFQGRLNAGGTLRIGSGATFDIRADTTYSNYPGAVLALDVVNEGITTVHGNALLTQGLGGYVPIPPSFSIVNAETGHMRFAGGNFFFAGTLTNYGVIDIENAPEFEGPNLPFDLQGAAFGVADFPSGSPVAFNNHGVVTIHRDDLSIVGEGIHSGRFETLSSESELRWRGDHAFLPGAIITGPGDTQFSKFGTISGSLQIEGDAFIERFENDIDASLDVGGTLDLAIGSPSLRFSSSLRAGMITGDLDRDFVFAGPVDIAFDAPLGSAEFLAPAIIRGDFLPTTQTGRFHSSAHITGSADNAIFMGLATIEGTASRVEFQRGASIHGDLTGYAHTLGAVSVDGDLTTTTGTWSFLGGEGNILPARLDVAGDATITRPFTIQGALNVGGDLIAGLGRYADITADTVQLGITGASTFTAVTFESGSRIFAREGPAVITRSRIGASSSQGANGDERIFFHSGFEIEYNPNTPFTRSGFEIVVNPDTNRSTAFFFLADSILAGTLDVGVFGDSALLSFGDSFTILEGRLPLGSADPLPTITGEFDRLFLPTLSDGLFFEVVYEPSAVRLVVVPAPAGIVLALAGLAPLARRRRSTLAES